MNPNCIRPPHFPPHCGCPAGCVPDGKPVLEPKPRKSGDTDER